MYDKSEVNFEDCYITLPRRTFLSRVLICRWDQANWISVDILVEIFNG